MRNGSKEWLVPLTGIAFILLVVASFVIAGDEPPSADEGAQKIVDHYMDNKDEIEIGAFVGTVAATALIFFFAYVAKFLRAAGGNMLPTLVVVGAAIVGVGASIDGMLSFVMAEAADDIEPESLQTIQAIWDNDWMTFALGFQVLWLALGISAWRTGALHKVLAGAAIALGIIALTPIGFVAFPGGALWILIVSVMLARRARAGGGSAPAPAA